MSEHYDTDENDMPPVGTYDPPRDLWAEWRRLKALPYQCGVTVEWEANNDTTFIITTVGFDADDTTDYKGSHADPEQAFRLALAAMEEQSKCADATKTKT